MKPNRNFPQAQPQAVPMIPEFEYRVFKLNTEDLETRAKEISDTLTSMSVAGWQLNNFQEAFFENHVVFTALLVRGREKKVLGPIGLA